MNALPSAWTGVGDALQTREDELAQSIRGQECLRLEPHIVAHGAGDHVRVGRRLPGDGHLLIIDPGYYLADQFRVVVDHQAEVFGSHQPHRPFQQPASQVGDQLHSLGQVGGAVVHQLEGHLAGSRPVELFEGAPVLDGGVAVIQIVALETARVLDGLASDAGIETESHARAQVVVSQQILTTDVRIAVRPAAQRQPRFLAHLSGGTLLHGRIAEELVHRHAVRFLSAQNSDQAPVVRLGSEQAGQRP